MALTYSIKFIGAQTSEAHNAELEQGARRFRTLNGAEMAAKRTCKAYDLNAEIYNEAGWLVLRITDGARMVP